MKRMSKKKAILIVVGSVIWFIAAWVIAELCPYGSIIREVFFGLALLGVPVLWLLGFVGWASAKGYHWFLGLVLGALGLFGVVILAVAPDKSVKASDEVA